MLRLSPRKPSPIHRPSLRVSRRLWTSRSKISKRSTPRLQRPTSPRCRQVCCAIRSSSPLRDARSLEDRLNTPQRRSQRAAEDAAKVYRALEDPYLRAREADLSDVSRAVIGKLLGLTPPTLQGGRPVILLADEIAPSEVLGLDRNLVLGVIDRRGGSTSHAAILLRSLGIPAIAGSGSVRSVCRAQEPSPSTEAPGKSSGIQPMKRLRPSRAAETPGLRAAAIPR